MDFTNFAVALCRPENSANVGSVCRAMKTMGFSELRVVGEKADFDEERVRALSVHGFDVWRGAKFFGSLQDAVSDCSLVAGTTRRRGARRKERAIFPEDFARLAKRHSGKVAVVFGNERTGMTDGELSLCNAAVEIPADRKNGSLNLSHAVQIICYALFRELGGVSPAFTPVPQSRLETSSREICRSLRGIGFYRVGGLEDAQDFFRDILSRAAVTDGELRRFERIFFKISGIFSKKILQKNENCDIIEKSAH